jgi:deazaflavin-dependent oxidoreductase (nitroreductase family)
VTEYRESTHARQWGVGWGPKFVRAVGHKPFARPLRWLIVRVDRMLYRVTRGRYLWSAMVRIPTLTLLVDSPKRGPMVVPLQYVSVGSRVYVVGTNWGRQTHPRWTGWLLDDGHCAVNIRGRRHPAFARLVEGADREELWPKLTYVSEYYERCQRVANRQLRVFHMDTSDPC